MLDIKIRIRMLRGPSILQNNLKFMLKAHNVDKEYFV